MAKICHAFHEAHYLSEAREGEDEVGLVVVVVAVGMVVVGGGAFGDTSIRPRMKMKNVDNAVRKNLPA